MADTPTSSAAPTLFGNASPPPQLQSHAVLALDARNLVDLLYDGFYMVFLLRNGYVSNNPEEYRIRIRQFLKRFEIGANKLNASADDIYMSKFAFCALVDETVLMSTQKIRDDWQRRPLQLEYFGEHMAGDRFFEHLEKLRQGGVARLQVLDVFHMCLLLGFQGRYIVEGSEKLNYLTSRLGDEIAHLQGKRAGFAPHWSTPDKIINKLRNEVPLWVIGSVFALAALLAFLGIRSFLEHQTTRDLATHTNIIKLAPEQANITITLP